MFIKYIINKLFNDNVGAILFYVTQGGYSAPEGDEMDFDFEGGYSAPEGGDVDFPFGS